MGSYLFCPYCKGNLIKESYEYTCDNCNKKVYINPAPCVTVIPVRGDEILLSIRRYPPFAGELDVLGGFIEPNETAEEAAIREINEETGLDIEIESVLGTYADTYGESEKYTLAIVYIAKVVGGEMRASDDITDLKWVKINDIPKLNLDNIFESIKETLKDFYKSQKID